MKLRHDTVNTTTMKQKYENILSIKNEKYNNPNEIMIYEQQ